MAKRTNTTVESLKHKDKRVNIPTEELRDFVADEEAHPRKIVFPGLLYARDPSLDPQLVWRGKDEQDQTGLEVLAVPIYIQEKIHPHAIIEEVRAQARQEQSESQMSLFADFNGIEFADQVDFYRHEQNWSNRMILGDSLQVMASLAEKEGLKGKVQMIYIDPPYGIKFGSNWQVSTRKRDVKDGKAEDTTRQPEQVKAFRDTWELGIHSYLSYLRDRLIVARELLTETGSVFVQIGDENVHLIRCMMDEIFGSENFCSSIKFFKTTSQTSKLLPQTMDYLLWYAKDKDNVKFRQLFNLKAVQAMANVGYDWLEEPDGLRRAMTASDREQVLDWVRQGFRVCALDNLISQSGGPTTQFDYEFEGNNYYPASGGWKTNILGMHTLHKANRLEIKGNRLRYVRYIDDFEVTPLSEIWTDVATGGFVSEEKVYVVQTNTKVIERCLLMTTDPGDLVLDPTCGSGTAAYVAELWGRRWITVDTSRVSIALARTRLMSARYPYYILVDSLEGIEKETEIIGRLPPVPLPKTNLDVRQGFVYKRVPHITLKAIANNAEIDGIHLRWQAQLDPIRSQLNQALGKTWEEWEVPRQAESSWSKAALPLLEKWWQVCRQRQQEIDASIACNADTELLYDQPYEDNKRIRVTGPFTVESLSPYRVLPTDEEQPTAAVDEQERAVGTFENIIIENLKRAGVQNMRKAERLKFDRLGPFAGLNLHASGEYTDADGNTRSVAVSIGPEHGTVDSDMIKDAAKEAVKGVGFDLLVVCGFAFDPHVAEESTRYGKLNVMIARMNPDLAMGDELLKKTGTGNLFMVFGEPDIEIKQQPDHRLVVTVKGVDVYDPTTGVIRSNSTDDIACWFIDTDYNEESFFVRHAYFTGAGDPYDKLKRALRAEIDEAAWASLYSTTSYPFDRPKKGKIAVKVINHYGDEVLKVFGV